MYRFRQASKQAIVVGVGDLFRRILSDSSFDGVRAIPVSFRWHKMNKYLPQIIERKEVMSCLTPSAIRVAWRRNRNTMSLDSIRHDYTIYDYEWETGLKDRDSTKSYWNSLIKSRFRD